jgi:hypothetical protein
MVTFGSPVTRDQRVCSLVISVIAPTTVAVNQAGVGVGLVSEAGEPWRFHVSNMQAAVESLGVTVEAATLQGGYASPDDAVLTLEDSLHVRDGVRNRELPTKRRFTGPRKRSMDESGRVAGGFHPAIPRLVSGSERDIVFSELRPIAHFPVEGRLP